MKTYTFHVQVMHCSSCVVMIESELQKLKEISRVRVLLADSLAEIAGEFGDKTLEHISQDLNQILEPHGYSFSVSRKKHVVAWSEFKTALPIALLIIALFILVQKMGVVNLINASSVDYGTSLVIGLVASISTCIAVVGGLVLSLSATFAKSGNKIIPQSLFHLSRLISFFVLGGVIGAVGSFFQLSQWLTLIISFLVALVLIIMGLNLLDFSPRLKKFQISFPKQWAKGISAVNQWGKYGTPLLAGAITFFLPCGFTQSMQMYTLTTANFWQGALTMFFFALGTLPVLALLSFGFVGLKKASLGIVFKSAGLVVIFFGMMNLANSLAALGIIQPLFSF